MSPSTFTATLALAGALVLLTATSAAGGGHTRGPGRNSELDTNQDGRISLQEAQNRQAELFAARDDDNNGSLSLLEYLDFPERPGHRWAVTSIGTLKDVREIRFAAIDSNDNDQVTRQELLEYERARFATADRNGDGFLSWDDRH